MAAAVLVQSLCLVSRPLPWLRAVPGGLLGRATILATETSFESSVASAPALCRALQEAAAGGGLAAADEVALMQMLATSNGARGFFVNWLTSEEWTAAESETPPQPLVQAICEAANQSMLSRLMLMNVAMPAATALAHERMGNENAAIASRLTARRASLLARAMLPRQPALTDAAATFQEAVDAAIQADNRSADFEWTEFLVRWGYDKQQLMLIRDSLDALKA
eukprot:scaffold278176_cov27-Tisochrysis_lutea.AAC.1